MRALIMMAFERTDLRRALVVVCALAYLASGFMHLTHHLDGAAPGPAHQIASIATADDPPETAKKAAAECCCVCAAPAMPFVAAVNGFDLVASRFAVAAADPLRPTSITAENPPPIG